MGIEGKTDPQSEELPNISTYIFHGNRDLRKMDVEKLGKIENQKEDNQGDSSSNQTNLYRLSF